ncbi:MAG: phosphate ABC transporter permease PstA [Candidatus Limnocylindrus sp.]|jgi:phosphate transport system permease protein
MSLAASLRTPAAGEQRRRRADRVAILLMRAAAAIAVAPLIALMLFVTLKAIPWLGITLFLNNPLDKEPGIQNAIIGSLQLSVAALLASAPIGVVAGIYLSEYAPRRIASAGELLIDIMLGVPSIIAGLFAYLVLVPVLGFSGWAAIVALSILMIPVLMRTTQEVLRLVPQGVKEASLALGIPVWKTTLFITCRTAFSGILTGLVLAFSRGLGETAPLILTARGTNAANFLDFGTTMNAMPIVIFQYSNAADSRSIGQAWATALILLAIALVLNVAVRGRSITSKVA